MAAAMLIFVHIFANVAVEYDIKQNLEREIYKNLKEVTINEDGSVVCSEDFLQAEGDIHFLIIDDSGTGLVGEYPEGCPQDVEVNTKGLHQETAGSETFYIRDIRKHGKKRSLYMRSVVRRSDTYSRYQTLEYLAGFSILVIFGIAIIGGVLLSKRISNSLQAMCRTAEEVGKNLNMSERMYYDGRIYELAVLAEADNRMLDRLEETFRQQEQFTSDVAHELRTPIAVVAAECQYVHKKSGSREEYQEAFEVIERQSAKVSAIISRLLELSRLDYDRRQINQEEIDLPEIVQSVCEDMQLESGEALHLKLNLKEARTIGDISLVAIAIQNLMTNAAKYSRPEDIIEVETGTEGNIVYVKVRDYGRGISEEDMSHIFKRFYKADKSRNTEGFGLGLPLTMKIAQKHGGTVLAESVLGQGSTFILQLPDILIEDV